MNKEFINGYAVPGGYSGGAVRRACEVILATPGITHQEVFNLALQFSELSRATSAWIIAIHARGPATHLWEVRREIPVNASSKRKVNCAYPNEFTHLLGSANEYVRELNMKKATNAEITSKDGQRLEPGNLVMFKVRGNHEWSYGTWVGYAINTSYFSNNPEVIDSVIDHVNSQSVQKRMTIPAYSQIMTTSGVLESWVPNKFIKIMK